MGRVSRPVCAIITPRPAASSKPLQIIDSMSTAAAAAVLAAMVVGAVSTAAAPPAPTRVHINREPNEQLAAEGPLHLGWQLPPDFVGVQRTFWVRVQQQHHDEQVTTDHECQPSQAIASCSASDGILLETLAGKLASGTSFAVSVRVVDSVGGISTWSAPTHFATALPPGPWPGGAVPVWAANQLQKFVLFRRSFEANGDEHLLHITAHGVPMRMNHAGANATKLLS